MTKNTLSGGLNKMKICLIIHFGLAKQFGSSKKSIIKKRAEFYFISLFKSSNQCNISFFSICFPINIDDL